MRRAILIFLLVSIFLNGEITYKNLATVPVFKKEPKIDGKIEEGEWDFAISTFGFQDILGKRQMDPRIGKAYFGFSEKYLYFLIISELPPDGKLITQFKNRDSDVIFDDGIEIWIDPDRDLREEKKEGVKNLYQCIINSAGAVYDVKFTDGMPDTGWNGNWEVANSIDRENKVWICEVRIPFQDIGIKNPYDRSIGILISRNYKRPWKQVTWFPHQGAFVSWFEYPRIFLTKEKIGVQIFDLGEKFFDAQPDFKVKIYNPLSIKQKVKVKIEIFSSNMPSLSDEKIIEIDGNGYKFYEFHVPENRFHPDADHYFTLIVSSIDEKEIYMMYRCFWTKPTSKKWDVRIGPDLDSAVKIAFLPTYGILKVKIDLSYLGDEWKNINSGEIDVFNFKNEKIFSKNLNWERTPYEEIFKIGDVEEGEYKVIVKLNGYKEPFERKFERIRFEWEGNKLGITDKIYKPFLPIKVNGNEVEVILRKYVQDGIGLWSSIKAKGTEKRSDYKELLAYPMAFFIDGNKIEGKGKFTKLADAQIIYEGESINSPVKIKTKCTTEYDGCMKVEMDLLPSQNEIKSLYLEIPLKNEIAYLMHVCTTSLRINPACKIPDGEGIIWTSKQFSDGNWFGNFKPYIWLGGEERGLCWFADNDKGWVIDWDRQPPCLVLEREGGILRLKVNLVQKPIKIEEARHIVFGLMASPAKPMPDNWRKVLFEIKYPGYKDIGWIGSTYWGCGEVMKEAYPLNKDMSVLTKIQECRVSDKPNVEQFLKDWAKRNLKDELPKEMKDKNSIIGTTMFCFNLASKKPYYLNVYWEEFHSISQLHPETKVFKYEWGGDYEYRGISNLAPSYIDFRCWFGAEFIRRGIGLYFDNAYPKRSYDILTSDAYVLPNGEIQPSANIWRHREYLKRIWILHQQLAPNEGKPLMMIHMTNTNIIPYLVWNEANLDLEWFYGPKPSQEKYHHTLLRTESIGRQSGNIPLVLANIYGGSEKISKEELEKLSRMKFGTFLVHEIKIRPETNIINNLYKILLDFGYGEEDCEVYNYWDEDNPVKINNPEVKTLLIKRKKECLVLFCSWLPKEEKIKVEMDLEKLGFSEISKVSDPETGENIKFEKNKIEFDMERFGVKFIKFSE